MLELKVHDGDREVVLRFEHSLLSLSKWESEHKKPFLATATKESKELLEYFECMLVDPSVNSDLVYYLSPEQMDELSGYINQNRTASSVPTDSGPKKGSNETVTSELIYYWMTALKINWEAEKWHLSRLMMLIQITNFKSQPEKKGKPDRNLLSKWRELNESNKKKFGTEG